MPYHVFIVEDHALMRDMMAQYIADLPDFSVYGTARTAEDALTDLPGSADLVLVDVSLPGMNGIELIGQLRTLHPDLPCLVCSGYNEAHYVEQALEAGARGYVAKGNPDELTDGLRCLRDGDTYLSPSLRERVEASSSADDE